MEEKELGQALLNICKDFQEYFEKEVPDQPIKCIDWIREILEMTREVVEESKEQAEQQSIQYEKMLQRSEKEVRTHIRIEQQLKLHIESQQQKIEDCERKHPKQIEGLKMQNDVLKKELEKFKSALTEKKEIASKNVSLMPSKQIKSNGEQNGVDKFRKSIDAEIRVSKVDQISHQKGKQIQNQEAENSKLKQALNEKNKNQEKLKSESQQQTSKIRKLSDNFSAVKKTSSETVDNQRKSFNPGLKAKQIVKKYKTFESIKKGSFTERQSYDGSLNQSRDYQYKSDLVNFFIQKKTNQQQNQSTIISKSQTESFIEKQRARSVSRKDKNVGSSSSSYTSFHKNNGKIKPSTAVKKNTSKK